MKKYLIGLLALTFLMAFTFGVLADNGSSWAEDYWDNHGYGEAPGGCYYQFQGDGIVIWINEYDPTNDDYTFLPFDRKGYTYDVNGRDGGKLVGTEGDNDQEVSITVPTQAFIPCYLELQITGNQGQTGIKSFGPESVGTVSTWNSTNPDGGSAPYGIVFDNEIGGFIDENWECLGRGSNFNLHADGLPDNIYIGACDIMMVEADGNEAYRYEVDGGPLAHVDGNGGSDLALHMRTSFDEGGTWEQAIFENERTETFGAAGNYVAGDKMEALHYFRVPVSTEVMHGMYEGEVVFRIVSI